MPAQGTAVADRLDAPVRLLPTKLWAGFAALAVAVGAAAVWATAATLPQHVSTAGLIVHGRAVVSARAPLDASVVSVAVTPGQTVRRGARIATLRADGVDVDVTAPAGGTVMSLLAAPGTAVRPGSAMATIDATGRPAHAVLLVHSAVELARLAPGQHVDVAGVPGEGRVRAVTPYPASRADLAARFGTADLPAEGDPGAATWLVDVALDPSAGAVGPALAPVSAKVLVGSVRPYRLVFGGSR